MSTRSTSSKFMTFVLRQAIAEDEDESLLSLKTQVYRLPDGKLVRPIDRELLERAVRAANMSRAK